MPETEENKLNEINARTADILHNIGHDLMDVGVRIPEPFKPKVMEIIIRNILTNIIDP